MVTQPELDEVLASGKALWPSLSLSTSQLAELIEGQYQEKLSNLDASEVYLACACALGQSQALSIFEERYFHCIGPSLASMSLGSDQVQEITQNLRIRLFVPHADERVARIVKYAGQGNLLALIRVAAVRAGLSLLRKSKRTVQDEDWLVGLPAPGDNPEFAQFKSQHRSEFKGIFEDAVKALNARERSLLRRHFVNKLSIDDIGLIYGVHRTTAARWLAKARLQLVHSAQELLGERWQLGNPEIADMLPMVESQIDLSLERLLQTQSDD